MGLVEGQPGRPDLFIFEKKQKDHKTQRIVVSVEKGIAKDKVISLANQLFLEDRFKDAYAADPSIQVKVSSGKEVPFHVVISQKGKEEAFDIQGAQGTDPGIKVRRLSEVQKLDQKSYTIIKKNILEKIFSPIITFFQWIFGKTYSDKAKEFLDEAHCRTLSGFKQLLKHSQSICSDEQTKKSLAHVVHSFDELEKANKNGTEQALATRYANQFTKDGTLTFGCGYLNATDQGPVFTPLLVTLSKKENKPITLTVQSSDPLSPQQSTYEIDGEKTLQDVLRQLLILAKKPVEKMVKKPLGEKSRETFKKPHEMSMWNTLHTLLRKHAIQDPEVVARTGQIAQKEKLVSHLLESLHPSSDLAHKAVFSLELFSNHIAKLLPRIEYFSKEDQKIILQELLQKYDVLVQELNQAFKLAETKDTIIQAFPHFRELFDAVRKAKDQLQILLKETKAEKNALLKTSFQTNPRAHVLIQKPRKTASDVSPLQVEKIEIASSLHKIKGASPQEAFKLVQTAQAFVEKAVKTGDFEAAKEIATKTLLQLPIPASKDDPVWTQVKEIGPFRDALLSLSHNLFEAKFKNADSFSTPDETVAIANAQAILFTLMKNRAHSTKLKMKECLEMALHNTKSEEFQKLSKLGNYNRWFDEYYSREKEDKEKAENYLLEKVDEISHNDQYVWGYLTQVFKISQEDASTVPFTIHLSPFIGIQKLIQDTTLTTSLSQDTHLLVQKLAAFMKNLDENRSDDNLIDPNQSTSRYDWLRAFHDGFTTKSPKSSSFDISNHQLYFGMPFYASMGDNVMRLGLQQQLVDEMFLKDTLLNNNVQALRKMQVFALAMDHPEAYAFPYFASEKQAKTWKRSLQAKETPSQKQAFVTTEVFSRIPQNAPLSIRPALDPVSQRPCMAIYSPEGKPVVMMTTSSTALDKMGVGNSTFVSMNSKAQYGKTDKGTLIDDIQTSLTLLKTSNDPLSVAETQLAYPDTAPLLKATAMHVKSKPELHGYYGYEGVFTKGDKREVVSFNIPLKPAELEKMNKLNNEGWFFKKIAYHETPIPQEGEISQRIMIALTLHKAGKDRIDSISVLEAIDFLVDPENSGFIAQKDMQILLEGSLLHPATLRVAIGEHAAVFQEKVPLLQARIDDCRKRSDFSTYFFLVSLLSHMNAALIQFSQDSEFYETPENTIEPNRDFHSDTMKLVSDKEIFGYPPKTSYETAVQKLKEKNSSLLEGWEVVEAEKAESLSPEEALDQIDKMSSSSFKIDKEHSSYESFSKTFRNHLRNLQNLEIAKKDLIRKKKELSPLFLNVQVFERVVNFDTISLEKCKKVIQQLNEIIKICTQMKQDPHAEALLCHYRALHQKISQHILQQKNPQLKPLFQDVQNWIKQVAKDNEQENYLLQFSPATNLKTIEIAEKMNEIINICADIEDPMLTSEVDAVIGHFGYLVTKISESIQKRKIRTSRSKIFLSKEALGKIAFPSYEKSRDPETPTPFSLAQHKAFYEKAKTDDEKRIKIQSMIYFLDALSIQREKVSLEDFVQAQNAEVLSQMLTSYLSLKNLPRTFTMPLLHDHAVKFVEELIPHILKKKEVLEKCFHLYGADQGEIGVDKLTCTRGSVVLDFATGSVTDVKGKVRIEESMQLELPKEIRNNRTFLQIFDHHEIVAKPCKGVLEHSQHFEFSLNSRQFQIEYNSATQELAIYQKINEKLCRFAHVLPDAASPSKELLEKFGIWIQDDDVTKGYVILGDQVFGDEHCQYQASMDKGAITALRDANNRELVFDTSKELPVLFPTVSPDRLLFLKDASGIQEIRIVGSTIRFERKGTEFVCMSQFGTYHVPVEGSKRFDTTEKLLKRLGTSAKKVILHLQQHTEKELTADKLLLFVKPFTTKLDSSGMTTLSFSDATLQDAPEQVIEATIDTNGFQTSATGFLYLATLSAAQKNLKDALFFLKEAQKSTLTPGEEQLFVDIADQLKSFQPRSHREYSFALKAHLTISSILRTQTQQRAFTLKSPTTFYETARYAAELYEGWKTTKKSREHVPKEIQSELALTDSEQNELEHVLRESMRSFIQKPETLVHVLDVASVKPNSENQKEFIEALHLHAKIKTSKKLNILSLGKPTISLVENFFDFADQIQTEKIPKNQLLSLLKEIEAPENAPELWTAIEFARKFLISLAEDQNKLDVQQLRNACKDLQKAVPIPTSNFQAVQLGIKMLVKSKKALEQSMEQLSKKAADANSTLIQLLSPYCSQEKESAIAATEERIVQIAKLKEALKDEKYTQKEKEILQKLLSPFEAGKITSVSESNFLKKAKEIGIDLALLSSLRLSELAVRIDDFVKTKRVPPLEAAIELPKNPSLINLKDAIEQIDAPLPKAAFEAPKNLDKSLQDALSEENRLQKLGIETAQKELQKERLKKDTLPDLMGTLNENGELVGGKIEQRIQELEASIQLQPILQKVEAYKHTNPEIRRILSQRTILGNEGVFAKLLNLYQRVQGTGIEELDTLITSYLVQSIEKTSLIEARRKTKDFHNLQPAAQVNCTTDVKNMISRSQNYDRYKEIGPSFAKKLFVAEFRRKILMRKEQIEAIQTMVKNPESLQQLRMGLGKTSYIIPIALMLLAEKGNLPIAIVPSQLLQMNKQSMDETTRQLIEQAAYELSLNNEILNSPTLIAQEMHRMLDAYQSSGYIIASPDTLALVENALTAATVDLVNKPEESEVALRHMVLTQFKSLLDGNLGIPTCYPTDEADDVNSVDKENNLALKDVQRKIDPKIQAAGFELFHVLASSEHEHVVALRKLLFEGKPASNTKIVEDGLKQAIIEIAPKKAIQPQALIDFIFHGKALENATQELAALKTFIQPTLLSILTSKACEIDFGIQSWTGCTTGPRQEKQEKANTNFSTDYELMAFNLLQYSFAPPSKDFLRETISQMKILNLPRYEALLEKAKIPKDESASIVFEKLVDFLSKKDPAAFQERLQILQKDVLDKDKIMLSKEEITLNVQDIFRGKKAGGISGTLTPYSLPEGFKKEDLQDAQQRKVEGETFTKVALKMPNGFQTKLKVVDDDNYFDEIITQVKDKTVRSVVNIGFNFKDKNALNIAQEVANRSTRDVIFIHPEKRKAYIWKVGASTPEQFSGLDIPESALVWYEPLDKRGTDFRFKTGDAIILPGPTANKAQYAQGVFRMRDLGASQGTRHIVPQSLAERIHNRCGIPQGSPITYENFLVDLQAVTVEQQLDKNLKAQCAQIHGMIWTSLRKVLFQLPEKSMKEILKNPDTLKPYHGATRRIFPHLRSWFIRKNDPVFDTGPTSKKDTFKVLTKRIDSEIANLKEARVKILKEYPQCSEQEQMLLHTAIHEITSIINDLESKKKEYVEQRQFHQKHLASEVLDGAESVGRTVTAEMQQQQQQQQQQMQQQQTQQQQMLGIQFADRNTRVEPTPSLQEMASYAKTKEGTWGEFPRTNVITETSIPVTLTKNAESIFKQVDLYQGYDFLRAVVVENRFSHERSVIIVSRDDVLNIQAEWRKNGLPAHVNASIYSFNQGKNPEAPHGVRLFASYSHNAPPKLEQDKALQEALFCVKKFAFLFKYPDSFTEKEQETNNAFFQKKQPQAAS